MGPTPSKPPGVLVYFPIRGRGEPIRLINVVAGWEWEQRLWDRSQKQAKVGTPDLPFGQVPVWMESDGGEIKTLSQSDAICRYLGRQCGMYGFDAWQDAKIDEILSGVESMRLKYLGLVYSAYTTEMLEAYRKLHVDLEGQTENCQGAHLGFLDILVARSETGWAAGTSSVSLADVHVFDIVDTHLKIYPAQVKQNFKHLMAVHERFAQIPAVAAYLVSDKRPEFVNGGAHNGN
jgi:glutathione S-transferase